MAYCPQCKAETAMQAAKCPHCGYEYPPLTPLSHILPLKWRRLIVGLLAAGLVAMFVVFAVAAVMVRGYQQEAAAEQEIIEQITAAGGDVARSERETPWFFRATAYRFVDRSALERACRVSFLIPDRPFRNDQVTDSLVHEMCKLHGLRTVRLNHTDISDEALADLASLPMLESLVLSDTRITDLGLESIAQMDLEYLSLARTRVADAGMRHLAKLQHLEYLDLWDTRVTDAGVRDLSNLQHLRQLVLWDTAVTDDGVKRLQQALPNCKIWHGPLVDRLRGRTQVFRTPSAWRFRIVRAGMGGIDFPAG